MNNLLCFLLTLSALSLISPFQFAYSAQDEQYHKDMILKDPKSEDAYYQYSFFLFGKERFPEALIQLKRLLSLNPKHPKAAGFYAEITRIEKIQDPNQRQAAILKYITDDMKATLNSVQNDLRESTIRQKVETKKNSNRQILEEKYDALNALEDSEGEAVNFQEIKQNSVALKYSMAGEKDKAEKIYLENISKFPESADSIIKLANLYIDLNRISDAKAVVGKGLVKFSTKLELLIIRDAIVAIEAGKSTEAKEKALSDLKSLQLEWSQMKLEKLNSKLGSP